MPLPNTDNNVTAASIAASPPPAVQSTTDPELADWNAYYELLLAGRLREYGGEFIAVHDGNVIGHGADADALRTSIAKQLGIASDRLVVPFVDDQECISAE